MTERRAMEAERDTIDRYVAAFLAQHVGEVMEARITGVTNFGFFAAVAGIGGDGLVPVSTLGAERFHFDEASRTLEGEESGERYVSGMTLQLRLAEANPVSGRLRFELPDGGGSVAPGSRESKERDRRGSIPTDQRSPPPKHRPQANARDHRT